MIDLIGFLTVVLSLIVFTAVVLKWGYKRLIANFSIKNYIVVHMLKRIGEDSSLIEIRTHIVPLKVRSFKNADQEYIIKTDNAIWRPSGIFNKPELHLYYEIGKPLPLTFKEPKVKVDADELASYLSKNVKKHFLTAQGERDRVNWLVIGLLIICIVQLIALIYLIDKIGLLPMGSTSTTPPVAPPR